MMQTAIALPANSGLTASACAALGLARASVYRARARLLRPPPSRSAKLAPPRALGPEERSRVLDFLRTPRFVDLSPAEICASIGADSLGYVSLEGLTEASELPASRLCRACFDGQYPIPVAEDDRGKHVLDGLGVGS